jgi:hypothetical protein
MYPRILAGFVLATFTVVCCGCGAETTPHLANSGLPAGVTLRVWPESFAGGGSAHVSALASPLNAGGQRLEISASQASELTALFVTVSYNPAAWHVLDARATGLLASGAGQLVELAAPAEPGKLDLGQVLVHADQVPAFNGSGVLATVDLEPGPAPVAPPVKGASIFGSGAANLLTVLRAGNPLKLEMYYGLNGDYDQNGEVNLADLKPLGQHLGEHITDPTHLIAAIDGDGNREINLGDIRPIAMNYRQSPSYGIYRSRSAADVPLDIPDTSSIPLPEVVYTSSPAPLAGTINYSDFTGDPATERLQCQFGLDNEPGYYYWVTSRGLGDALMGFATLAYLDVPFQHVWDGWNLTYDAANQTLQHFSVMPGDYDGNGEANIGDLTMVGMQFGSAGPFAYGTAQHRVDANFDDVVNLDDIRWVDLHLGQHCESFNVYMTQNPAEVPVDPYAPSTLTPIDQSNGTLSNFDPPSGSYVWIRPRAGFNDEGPCSATLQIP